MRRRSGGGWRGGVGPARRPVRPHLAVRPRTGQPVRGPDREVLLQRDPGGHHPAAGPGRDRFRRRAGTVQEVFQAATKAFYATDGASGPFVFLDTEFWTGTLPVEKLLRPLLADSPYGDLAKLVHVTDDVDEAVELLRHGAPATARDTQRTTP